ncbi:putative DNA binding CopG/RHH family protein [Sphingomonas sp. PvP055]|uniref:BrnA antitoxin family protein n=1 Tax=Sphingomonas sp. PvP055 TaxID=3156391 RepID=UPI003395511F
MSEDKLLPLFSSDDDAEAFVGSADLTGYDLSALTPTRFEFSSKDARVNMRLPVDLLDAVKATAARKGMPYQRFIRQALEQALHG